MKAKAKPETKPEESAPAQDAKAIFMKRKQELRWAQSQLDAVEAQRQTAASKGDAWLEEPHKFHESGLRQLVKCLDTKLLDEVPAELRSSIEVYVAQCAEGAADKKDGFIDDREMYKSLPVIDEPVEQYVRVAETSPEAATAMETITAWEDISEEGMAKFVAVLQAQLASPCVQEAGMARIGALCSEQAKEGKTSEGLQAGILLPAIQAGMQAWLKDIMVQHKGCSAIRGLALTEGQLAPTCEGGGAQLLVTALQTHFKNEELCMAGNGAFWAMSQRAGKNSPELAWMRDAGAIEVLMKVMQHHAWNQTLVGRVRLTLPFLKED